MSWHCRRPLRRQHTDQSAMLATLTGRTADIPEESAMLIKLVVTDGGDTFLRCLRHAIRVRGGNA